MSSPAALWQGGFQLHELFVYILLHCQPTDSLQLWRNHSVNLSDDCHHQLQIIHQIGDPLDEQVQLHFNIFLIFNRSSHSLCASFTTFSIETILISISMIFLYWHTSLHWLV